EGLQVIGIAGLRSDSIDQVDVLLVLIDANSAPSKFEGSHGSGASASERVQDGFPVEREQLDQPTRDLGGKDRGMFGVRYVGDMPHGLRVFLPLLFRELALLFDGWGDDGGHRES